ncbi:had atpase, p-type, ic family protein [Lacticaseibacillus pantheris DSM 15945 = JCM 12539 = NBRC 106106]|uniref:P-type Ca(2+) transporter n=1 Tax=Lacticaseibacillus pantheris DSM 15945 = JCM 12539 = NBRC 106106 TaxID=1423783 RepID=A0A0R1U0N8_9LACO|nr:cation-translocating P-type ATPase [Lacticaseibacillus pantheris]KRL86510.1 had atpase, p-type, ic family protein [Lacticaseibacillus pantheris DSM 15945 = JCM 12539 = NBRC 106106]
MANKPSYQRDTQSVMQDQKTTADGLSSQEAQDRLNQYGPNALAAKKKKTLLGRFLDQFKDFMIIVLLVAALVAGVVVHEWADAAIILAVVLLNAVFGVFQESKAEQAIESLQAMTSPNANVRRDGKVVVVPSSEVVPGDIILLEAGDVVPADLRLIESANLQIEESALTGESVPVNKQIDTIDEEAGIGDRTNMAFMSTNVTYGRGLGVVTGTGMQTEVGHIASMLDNQKEMQTPLQANLAKLGRALTVLILVIAAIVFVVGLAKGSEDPANMFLTAISLAVAAIPEGLPAIVTIILALGTQKMAKQNALVRRLPAVETLGSTEIIASDKTGTLTQNKMTVEQTYYDGELHPATEGVADDSRLLQIMSFANDTNEQDDGTLLGDPTETALVAFAKLHDFDYLAELQQTPRVAEVPFDSERKLMSTIHDLGNGQFLVATKGAPDELLRVSSKIDQHGTVRDLTESDRDNILGTNHQLATQALRVLGMAYQIVDQVPVDVNPMSVEQELTFAGLVAMIDPERPEVRQSVEEAKRAGIRPLMITGDHRDTAQAISERLGIITPGEDHAVITGRELDQISDEDFANSVQDYSVYARVAPEHKVRIVNAWQGQGKVVAMTGDGVNDAPALKAADIGIAMGVTGTEVAKGASDMILADDNFSTIVDAVRAGRKVFANITKSIQYLLSANLGEVLTLFMMTMIGWDILAPVHILWINLVTDTLPAIALGVEHTERGIMQQKPRGRNSSFLSGGVGTAIIWQGLLEGALTLGVYWLAITFPVHTSSAAMHADALTMAYVTLGLIQLFHAFNVKSLHGSLFSMHVWNNKAFNWAIGVAALALAVTVVVPGFNGLFHVTTLNALQWGMVAGAGILMILVVEIVKFFQRRVLKVKI